MSLTKTNTIRDSSHLDGQSLDSEGLQFFGNRENCSRECGMRLDRLRCASRQKFHYSYQLQGGSLI